MTNWYETVSWQPPCKTRAKLTNLARRSPVFQQAYKCAIKDAIAWLHHEAETAKDWRATKVLNSAATQFGMEVSNHNKGDWV